MRVILILKVGNKMKLTRLITAGLLSIAVTGVAHAQTFTQSVEIRSIETLADSKTTFIRSSGGGWGLAGCPNAQFVNITDANASYREILATALTARASGLSVTARGVCSTSGNSVIAERLRID